MIHRSVYIGSKIRLKNLLMNSIRSLKHINRVYQLTILSDKIVALYPILPSNHSWTNHMSAANGAITSEPITC